jgi:hypothetical protein
MKKLKDLNKPFKYIGACSQPASQRPPVPRTRLTRLTRLTRPVRTCAVTSVVMQKNGAGLHTATSCFWDNTSDGALSPHPPHRPCCTGLNGR